MVAAMSVEQPPLWEVPSDQPRVRTWLWPSAIAAALCFLPLGIVAVIYGIRADAALGRGDYAAATRSARVARRWFVVTVVVGIIVELALVVAFLGLGAGGTAIR